MRTCKTCHRTLSESDFYRVDAGRYFMGECKECWKSRVKLRRLTDPAVRAYERERAKEPHRVASAIAETTKWRNAHPVAYRAQNIVNNALRDGKLEKGPCAICGATEHVHGHHKDYSKPLEVTWLCARCHHRLHSVFPELGGNFETREFQE